VGNTWVLPTPKVTRSQLVAKIGSFWKSPGLSDSREWWISYSLGRRSNFSVFCSFSGFIRSRNSPAIEIAVLMQELSVLRRKVPRSNLGIYLAKVA
jgi:hypothetical protein